MPVLTRRPDSSIHTHLPARQADRHLPPCRGGPAHALGQGLTSRAAAAQHLVTCPVRQVLLLLPCAPLAPARFVAAVKGGRPGADLWPGRAVGSEPISGGDHLSALPRPPFGAGRGGAVGPGGGHPDVHVPPTHLHLHAPACVPLGGPTRPLHASCPPPPPFLRRWQTAALSQTAPPATARA